MAQLAFPRAIQQLKAILMKKPGDLDALYYLALSYDQSAALDLHSLKGPGENRREALHAIKKGLHLSPRDPRLLHTRGIIFLHTDRPKEAMRDFTAAYEYSHRKAQYLLSIANAYRRLEKPLMAIRIYRRVMRRKAISRLLIYHNLANTYLSLNDIRVAKREARKGLQLLRKKKLTAFDRLVRRDLLAIVSRDS